MKNWYLLILPLILIGAGCNTASTITQEVSEPEIEDVDETITENENESETEDEVEEVKQQEEDESAEEDATEETPGEAVSFNISGRNFAFSQSEIRVAKGDTVTINFESESGLHDWRVDAYNAATTTINTGGSTSVTFIADQTGTFEYYCSVGNHRAQGMVGSLIVE